MSTQATVFEVENKARDLLDVNGKTTTLEIKHALRDDGFRVTQEEVAHSMYVVWAVNDWHWTFNGTYRTYYPCYRNAVLAFDRDKNNIEQTSWLGWLSQRPTTSPAPPAPTPTAQASAQMTATRTTAQPDPVVTRAPLNDRLSGLEITTKALAKRRDWIAYIIGRDNNGQVPPAIYVTGVDENLSYNVARDTVRTFAKDYFATDYFKIRANYIADADLLGIND
jgi:hypothetical protein